MPVRGFDGIDDDLRTPVGGGLATLDAATFAVLCRPAALRGGMLLQLHNAAGNGSGYGVEIDDDGALGMWNGDTTEYGPPGFAAAATWRLLVVGKAAGRSAPRVHMFDFSTGRWTREDLPAMESGFTVVGGTMRFANWEGVSGGFLFAGDFAAAAVWPTLLNDTQVDALAASTLTAWTSVAAPISVWLFNQDSTTTPVTDLMGVNNQSAITGTSIVNDDPPIPYEAAPSSPLHVHDGTGWTPADLFVHDGSGWVEQDLEVL